MPVVVVQGEIVVAEGDLYPLQVATDGCLVADPDNDTKLALLMATDGYLLDE